jgi:hypothetical protein
LKDADETDFVEMPKHAPTLVHGVELVTAPMVKVHRGTKVIGASVSLAAPVLGFQLANTVDGTTVDVAVALE